MRGKPKKGVLRHKILSFQNYYKVLKTCSAGRKDFFDTLKPHVQTDVRFMLRKWKTAKASCQMERNHADFAPSHLPSHSRQNPAKQI